MRGRYALIGYPFDGGASLGRPGSRYAPEAIRKDAPVTAAEPDVPEIVTGPVALKVQSPQINHKADVGGVKLGLATADQVRDAFAAVAASVPPPVLEGVLVQRMAPPGVEAFVAARREPLLGPLVVVGLGGTEVEALRDVAMRLAPVSLAEAHAMIDELRGGSLLRSRADVSALAAAVVRLSELAAGLPPGISNVEINPLLVLPRGQGVLMLDAAVELKGGEPW